MSESSRNLLLTIGAGVLVASVGFVAGRLSVPAPAPVWETSSASSAGSSNDYRAVQSSIDEQRRAATVRETRIRQELDQQRYDAEMERVKTDRARIDAETELARQKTEQMLDQQRQAAEMERLRLDSARRDAYLELARQRTQQMLDELSRKR